MQKKHPFILGTGRFNEAPEGLINVLSLSHGIDLFSRHHLPLNTKDTL